MNAKNAKITMLYALVGLMFVQQVYANQGNNPINIKQLEQKPIKPLNDDQLWLPPVIEPVIAPTFATPSSAPNNNSIESQIETALVNENWQTLERLLARYQTLSKIDQTLYDYAMGAKLRSEGKHAQAIAYYERITKDPSLIYPAFDLAVMYFEDKQYRNAERIFTRIAPQMPAPMQAVIVQYLSAINNAQSVTPSIGLNYERNNNVNNVYALKELNIKGLPPLKRADEPQSGQGIKYNAGVSLDKNIAGNHYAYGSLSGDGVYYWDNKDYSLLSMQADVGYRYKDVLTSISVVPFAAQSMLGAKPYQKQYGLNVSYNKKITPNLQAGINLAYADKRYANQATANRYDGISRDGTFVLSYHPSSQWLWHMGLDARREDLKDVSESSTRLGVRLGATYANNDMGVRVLARIAKRDFLADNFWYRKPRVDIEKQATTTIWHNKLSWRGITPSLNYRWERDDSNLPAFDRNREMWFIGLEKTF